MGKKNRLSRDQKRKAKLAKKAHRPSGVKSSLAYRGDKYRTDDLVPVYLETELGIFESHVMTGRQLTDRTVAAALERLVAELNHDPLPLLADTDNLRYVEGQEEDLIIENIRRHWQALFEDEPHPGSERLTGVLRTILGSVEVWSTPSRHSRGYLSYLEGFLREAGASVKMYSAEGEPLGEPEEDDLLVLGRAWRNGADRHAAAEFRAGAEALIRSGQAERVAEVCQRLIGESPGPEVIAELSVLALRAHEAMR
jgi:hypothetical protein